MAKLPIIIAPDDETGNSLTVSFTKQDFSQFVFNLFVTPRDERRTFYLGFDAYKDDLQNLIGKLDHHINTHHELLNRSLTIDLRLVDGVDLTYSSSEQFFNIDDPRSESVKSISVTATYVIAFFRDGKKNFERQIVDFNMYSGAIGKVVISIRSTDVSWPNGIFALLEREISDLSKRTVGPNGRVARNVPYHSFSRETFDADPEAFTRHIFAAPIFGPFSFGFLISAIVALAFFVSILNFILEQNGIAGWVLSNEGSRVMPATAITMLEQYGPDEAVKRLLQGEILHKAGMPTDTVGSFERIVDYIKNVPHLVFVFGLMVAIAVFVFVWNNQTKKLSFVGRILVFTKKSEARANPSIVSSVLPSLALGILAGLLGTALWELTKF